MIIEDQKFTPYKDGLAVIPHKEETTSVSADEMFEELEYETLRNKDGERFHLEYARKDKDGNSIVIQFWNDKTISKSDSYGIDDYITMQELQAINEKCKELGWI